MNVFPFQCVYDYLCLCSVWYAPGLTGRQKNASGSWPAQEDRLECGPSLPHSSLHRNLCVCVCVCATITIKPTCMHLPPCQQASGQQAAKGAMCTCVCVCVCICVCVCVCLLSEVFSRVCMCTCKHVCVCECVYSYLKGEKKRDLVYNLRAINFPDGLEPR